MNARRSIFCVGLALAVAVSAQASQLGEPISQYGVTVASQYVGMRDGTKLAVDVWNSETAKSDQRKPTILMLTRYWRAFRSQKAPLTPGTLTIVRYFAGADYEVVIADMRGTGASFGFRDTEFSSAEVQDYGELIDWIAKQSWSNGRVATLGASYLGNAAEFAAIPDRPALKAVVPEFSDYSEYRDAIRPGGIMNTVIAKAWVAMTAALDRNDGCAAFSPDTTCSNADPWYFGVRPVDTSPAGLRELRSAVSEHTANVNLANFVDHLVYSDDRFGRDAGDTLDSMSVADRWRRIDRAGVPAFHWTSWFDGGTAEGTLTRFMNYRHTPMYIVIGAWNHGGTSNANPYDPDVGRALSAQRIRAHLNEVRQFLDPLMLHSPPEEPADLGIIRYFTVGVNRWQTTRIWPPRGLSNEKWFFGPNHSLSPSRSDGSQDQDVYHVNFAANTGAHNRWHTQLGGYVKYPDRRTEDHLLLTYTSRALQHDTEITGSPVLRVFLKSSRSDGALFAYLEDVAPDGGVTYLTEGEIRLLFSGKGVAHPGFKTLGPLHTFERSEARPLAPGKIAMFWFALRPISVVLRRGHRIRVAISGADAGTFERLPATGPAPTWTILRDPSYASEIKLPMRRWNR